MPNLTYLQTNELRRVKKKKGERFSPFSNSVPRPGIEPGWVPPLVFETSASTYSAIWASFLDFVYKDTAFTYIFQIFKNFFSQNIHFSKNYNTVLAFSSPFHETLHTMINPLNYLSYQISFYALL